jgi:hypothetical protein
VSSYPLLDLGEGFAEPHHAGNAAVGQSCSIPAERHHRHFGIELAENSVKSSMSAGSKSHSASPPLLNHTRGASGASEVSFPFTLGIVMTELTSTSSL